MTTVNRVVGRVMLGLAGLSICGLAMAQTVGEPGMIEVVVAVELTCPSCAQGLERRLARLDHVTRVEIQGDEGRVVLGVEPGTNLALEEVWDVIRNAGFTPAGVSLTAIGRLIDVNGEPGLALVDDTIFVLAGDRVGALSDAARLALVRVNGEVSLATDGGAAVLTIGQLDVP